MIADRIKFLREQHGMNQADLARILGITRSSINAWELGISVPSTQYIIELSNVFKVPTDYLLCVDHFPSVNVDGLTDEDVRMIYTMVNYLRSKNQSNISTQ